MKTFSTAVPLAATTTAFAVVSYEGQTEAGEGASGSGGYAGITGLDGNEALDPDNFVGFDFDTTLTMEGALVTPIDLRALQPTAFQSWQVENDIPDVADDEMVNGIPALARYVFGIKPDKGPADLSEQLIDIKFDADGTWKPADGSAPPKLSFKWRIDFSDE